jgi:glycosyltransferase 2 family protein
VLWFAYRALRGNWGDMLRQPLPSRIGWGWVASSTAAFALAYLVLIQTWRRIVARWDRDLSFVDAARIWLVSGLGRYVPGKLWAIAAMGAMAQRAGVSPVAATGSSVLNVVVNIAAGFVVVMATGWRLLALPYAGAPVVAVTIVVLAVILLMAVPWLTPQLLQLAQRVTGRSTVVGTPPRGAIGYAVVGNLIGWILYGLAFQLLARALFGSAPGGLAAYVAVYALSYLVGYLALLAPAGVGVREASMVALMPAAGLASAPQALVLAVASRLVLTILDIVPGLLLVGRDAVRRPSRAP